MKLDGKIFGTLVKVKNNEYIPDDEWVVFFAKDNAFYAILPLYLEKCRELGCDQEHCDNVVRLIERVNKWRLANPSRCKNPDAKGEKLLG